MRPPEGVAEIVAAVRAWQKEGGSPTAGGGRLADGGQLVVAIDGHGGSGKTTLAEFAAGRLDAALVHTDDYFRDGGSVDGPATTPMASYYDWERMRADAILPALRAGGAVTRPLIIEGVSSASPALADLVTHSVLVVTPEPMRLERLHGRISESEWDEVWLAEERRYFGGLPEASFDLVVSGGG